MLPLRAVPNTGLYIVILRNHLPPKWQENIGQDAAPLNLKDANGNPIPLPEAVEIGLRSRNAVYGICIIFEKTTHLTPAVRDSSHVLEREGDLFIQQRVQVTRAPIPIFAHRTR